MIIDNQKANESIAPNSLEMEQLKQALPQYFDAEGNFKNEQFQAMLANEKVDFSKESYELSFVGKSYGKYLSSLKTETVLVPDIELNNLEENKDSENVYITGDNLDALKHLKESYSGAIKCIYIDPPYNTGKGDFAYLDDFNFTLDELVDKIGLTEQEAERVLDLHGKSSHSAWLTFMLPRLLIAKQLLKSTGVIIVSIDDNEQANLKLLLDDVFGENNFIAQIARKGTGGKQDSTHLATVHEYALIYAKNAKEAETGRDSVGTRSYRFTDPDGRKYRTQLLRKWGDTDRREDRENLYYAIPAPDGSDLYPIRSDGSDGRWRWDKDTTMKNAIENNLIHFEQEDDGTWIAHQKIYEDEDSDIKVFNSWIDKSNDLKEDKLKELFTSPPPFKYPKLVGYLIQLYKRAGVEKDDIVLDFFSGSGSSAHALYRMNAADGGSRKMISVQIDAVLDAGDPGRSHDFNQIDEIGRERIKRAAANIKAETDADIDYGFKHFKLHTPPQSALDDLVEFELDEALLQFSQLERFNTEDATGQEILLATWANYDGYGLINSPESIELDSFELFRVGRHAYILDAGMESEDVVELIRLLENDELDITTLVYLNDCVQLHVLQELKQSLKNLHSSRKVKMIARY